MPWLPLPPDLTPVAVPSPQAVPVPPGTPRCAQPDLQGAFTGSNGATGHVEVGFAFASRGVRACYVEGTPAVVLLDAAGLDLGFKNRAPYFPDEVSGRALVEPGPPPSPYTALKYGQAGLTIDWVSQPEACPLGEAASHVGSVRIQIADVGPFTFRLPAEPVGYACQGVGVGDLADPPIEASPPAQAPLPDVTIEAPATVKAGTTLNYVVMLSDSTRQPTNLPADCPNYEEELFPVIASGSPPLGGKHIYQLNCKAAGGLAPGKPMAFAMVIPVPADAARGDYTLVFDLGRSNELTKLAAKAVVTVV